MAKKIEKIVALSSGNSTVACYCSECKNWVNTEKKECPKCKAKFDN